MKKKPETGKFTAILLAAGSSSRLGQPKQLVRVAGESLVRRAACQLLNLNPVNITVVTGFASDAVEHELYDLPVRFARNDNWEQGMGGSIACGIQNISEEVDGALISVCDQWRIEDIDLARLISAWSSDISSISVASWHDRKTFIYGAPVLFARKYFRELKDLKGNKGAKTLIGQHLNEVQFIEMENAACDLDRPEDLEQLLKRS